MNIKNNLLNFILFFIIILSANSKAELTNKVIISVGNEIITNFDIKKEFTYLNIISMGQLKEVDNAEAEKWLQLPWLMIK